MCTWLCAFHLGHSHVASRFQRVMWIKLAYLDENKRKCRCQAAGLFEMVTSDSGRLRSYHCLRVVIVVDIYTCTLCAGVIWRGMFRHYSAGHAVNSCTGVYRLQIHCSGGGAVACLLCVFVIACVQFPRNKSFISVMATGTFKNSSKFAFIFQHLELSWINWKNGSVCWVHLWNSCSHPWTWMLSIIDPLKPMI